MRFEINLKAWQWPFYVMRHPFEGYEDLRWKKGYDMRVALVIVLAFFIVSVMRDLLIGFLYGGASIKVFNVVPYISSTIILFFLFVIGNWALCTLFDGEGSMKNICCVTAFALVPLILSMILNTILSNILLPAESAFYLVVEWLGILWSVIMLLSGMRVVHQYSVPKTLIAVIFTVVAMLIMIFIAVLLMTLFQQVFIFGYSIYTEIQYRISM
jgi:hypothetical protein